MRLANAVNCGVVQIDDTLGRISISHVVNNKQYICVH
jgi:hypothetical protein